MPEGISKTIFITGLVVAVLTSSALSTVVSMNYARGHKGDKGDTGSQGIQGIQGIQGPLVDFTIGNISGLLPSPAYDSGWIVMNAGWHVIQHNLNTVELMVYLIFKSTDGILQYANNPQWAWWELTSPNNITIVKQYDNPPMVRVMLWKISQP
jgi:hypothetical protein